MKHNLNQVLIALQAAFDDFARKRDTLVRKVAFQTYADIITMSPVDTGLYRASHDLTVNTPSTRIATVSKMALKSHRKRKRGGKSSPIGALTTKASANQDAALRRLSNLKGKRYKIYITNNLSYAHAIENGSSKQAAKGVYKIARMRALRMLRQGLRNLK